MHDLVAFFCLESSYLAVNRAQTTPPGRGVTRVEVDGSFPLSDIAFLARVRRLCLPFSGVVFPFEDIIADLI